MAAWCFVCDAPVEGNTCTGCGRAPTVVDDPTPIGPSPLTRLWGSVRSVSPVVWWILAVVLVVALFSLLRVRFRLM